jgi:inositol-phosphate transport system ATP-binding protein
MARVDLVGLRKSWGPVAAVEEMDLAIGDGEFLAVLGPSGCGKSTTLFMLAGIYAPTGGDIRFDGIRVNEVEARGRNVGIVFQSYALYPHMSVADNIGFPLRFKGIKGADAQARIKTAASLVQVSELLDRRPAQLSGGQQQRVALARALIKEPGLLLLDEPLSNLDATLRLAMRSEIRRLQRRLGVTTLLVTHDQIEATTMADRIVVMNKGRIEQVGTADDLYRRPSSVFVASFVGAPPINLVEGQGVDRSLHVGEALVPVEGALASHTILGIRPEHVHIGRDGTPAKVASVEPMGRETLILLETALGALRTLIPITERAPKEGDTIAFTFAPSDAMLFDAASGQRLTNTRVSPFPQGTRFATRH